MNTRSFPYLVSVLSVTLSFPLLAKDNPTKVTTPQKPQVQSLKKAPAVKPEAKKAPKKASVPSKPQINLKKIAPKKVKPIVKPSIKKPTKIKPKSLKPSLKKPPTSKPSSVQSVKSPSSKQPPAPKTKNLPSKPKKSSLPTKTSVGNILGTKGSAKSSGLIPKKVPSKKTASIPAPKKVDPSSKSETPGAMKKPALSAKKTAPLKTQDLSAKPVKAAATAAAASSLTIQPSTDLQINQEDIGQSAENLTENLGQRESLGDRAGIDVAGKTTLGERSGVGNPSGKGGKGGAQGAKERLAAQMGLAAGKLAGLGGKGDVADSDFFGEGTARWNENDRGKLNRGAGANYAEVVYTHHDEATGKDWTVTVSLQNPGAGFEENDEGDVYANKEKGVVVIAVTKSVKNFKKRGEVTAYADSVADLFGVEVSNAMGGTNDDPDPGNGEGNGQPATETDTDTFQWAWEDDTDDADQDASQTGDGDKVIWAWADDSDSSSEDSTQGEQDDGETDEFRWAWEDDSSSDDDSTDGSADPDATPDPDSGSDQRTADGDTPGGNGSGQEDESKVAAALNRGGGSGTIRTGGESTRGGVSQTKTGSSTDNDTVRIDPDNVQGAEDTARLRALIGQKTNPEEGQSGQEGGVGGSDLPSPFGGLTGGPVADPTGGGGDPSTLRKGASGGTLLEAIRQQDVQINEDSLKNVQQIKQ